MPSDSLDAFSFFSAEPSTPKEECEKKKKKATNKRKRSQFKFQKNLIQTSPVRENVECDILL